MHTMFSFARSFSYATPALSKIEQAILQLGTEKPTDPTEDPTDAPAETDPPKGGCKSTVGLSALLVLGGAALLIRKKKED